ncbi:MAG: translation initiation factor IF-2 [Acidobacteriota bacterium]
MAKIRVKDLAQKMGIPHKDLQFKLRSIGVRVEGDDAQIDTSILQAIVKGTPLTPAREVIVRDDNKGGRRGRPAPPKRRTPSNPLQRNRPRTMINQQDQEIRTLPQIERSRREREEAAAKKVAQEKAKLEAARQSEAAARKAEEAARRRRLEAEEAAAKKAEEDAKREAAAEAAKTAPQKAAGAKGQGAEKAEKKARSLKKSTVTANPANLAAASDRQRSSRGPRSTGGRKRRRSSDRSSTPRPPVKEHVLSFKADAPDGPVMIAEGMTVRDFAEKLGVKVKDLIKSLFARGQMASINDVLDAETAESLATELGVETMVVSFEEEVQLQQEQELAPDLQGKEERAPVITVMGHVDHGKTSLLDRIRSSRVAEGESGGITQHIGAHQVDHEGNKIVFLDTPGHEAFTTMRARGAKVTDIVILVVAADDGVMPQTIEAIDHARAANVPIIVAINKIDKANANPDRVKKELADHNLLVESWGGDVVSVEVSALQGKGIDELLEMLLLQSELLELKANSDIPAQGVVLEARKDVGRGVVATVLVQNGTLSRGDSFVAGMAWGRVRSLTNDIRQPIQAGGPSTPVEISGFQELPEAGDTFQVLEDEGKARDMADYRREQSRQRGLSPTQAAVSLDQLFERIEAGEVKELPVVLKADVSGSLEVLKDTLAKSGNEKVKVKVIHSGIGAISTNDVILAQASQAIILGFNVRPERNASDLADKEHIDVRLYTVIYELIDELKQAMAGLLDPTFREVQRGRAEVRELFKIPRIGVIAGSHVLEGTIRRNSSARLLRDNVVVYEGKVSSLRRFKDDATEVRSGFDCGIGLDNYNDLKPGDVIEVFAKEEVAATL